MNTDEMNKAAFAASLRSLLDDFKATGPASDTVARTIHRPLKLEPGESSLLESLAQQWQRRIGTGPQQFHFSIGLHPTTKVFMIGGPDLPAIARLCVRAGELLRLCPAELASTWPATLHAVLRPVPLGGPDARWIEFLHAVGWSRVCELSATRISRVVDVSGLVVTLHHDPRDWTNPPAWWASLLRYTIDPMGVEATVRDASILVATWLLAQAEAIDRSEETGEPDAFVQIKGTNTKVSASRIKTTMMPGHHHCAPRVAKALRLLAENQQVGFDKLAAAGVFTKRRPKKATVAALRKAINRTLAAIGADFDVRPNFDDEWLEREPMSRSTS